MPIVTLIKPMTYNHGGGWIYRYLPGQYSMPHGDAFNWYVMLHSRNGKPELDSTQITDPGPPPVLLGPLGWSAPDWTAVPRDINGQPL
jgi:hypothetical protein